MRLHLSEELTGLEVLGPRALMGATLAGSSVAEHFVAPTIKYERPVFLIAFRSLAFGTPKSTRKLLEGLWVVASRI